MIGKKSKRAIAFSISAVLLIMCIFACIKFIDHEQKQNARIRNLDNEINILKSQLISNSDSFAFVKACQENRGDNYLAIGNSITIHPPVDYWWAEYGMAASKPEKDYFHIVVSELGKQEKVVSYAYNFAVWETQYMDRAETVPLIDNYLNSDLTLITIQLGENVSDLSTYEADFVYLIRHIREKAPEAEIIVVSDFWDMEMRDEAKAEAVSKCGVKLANISTIKGNKDYMCEVGSVIYGDDGMEHIVEHSGVAHHPSDEGMDFIAAKIIEIIQEE